MKRALCVLLVVLVSCALAACQVTAPAPTTTSATAATPAPSTAPTSVAGAKSTPEVPVAMQKPADLVVTDLLGRKVSIRAGAQSFAAIGPGCLRLYTYVADVSKLTGIEQMEVNDISGRPYMLANKKLQKLPVIGPGGPNNAPDAEKLLASDPDVIFTMYNSEVSDVDELQEKTGIPVVALSYGVSEMFDPAVDESLTLIGKVTGHEERAAKVVAYLASLKNELASRTASISRDEKPLAYVGGLGMRGVHGIESTNGNFSLFNAVGVRNAVAEAGINKAIMLDKEKLLEMNPDVVFIDGSGLHLVTEDYSKNKAFYDQLDAFKNGKVYMLLPYNYYYTNIDIAVADAYFIGTVLYPKQFADVSAKAKFDEIMNTLLGKSLYSEISKMYYGGYQQLKF